MDLDCVLNQARSQVAAAIGELFYVYRPVFTQVNQTPNLIASISANVNPGGGKYAIPNIPLINYFTVTCNRYGLQFGDILQPVDSMSAFPIMTILNFSANLPMIAFRTSRLANITLSTSAEDQIYTNVYYDFLSPTYFQHGDLQSLGITTGTSSKKIAMWSRTNVQDQNTADSAGNPYSIEGMRLIAADGPNPVRYLLRNSTSIGNIFIADVSEEVND